MAPSQETDPVRSRCRFSREEPGIVFWPERPPSPAPALPRREGWTLRTDRACAALSLLLAAAACRAEPQHTSERPADAPQAAAAAAAPARQSTPGRTAPAHRPPDHALDSPVRLVDAAGRRHQLARPARRIISLVPAASEILLRLGAGPRLVGRTDYDLAPPELARLPSVGGGLHPSIERIVALRPDLVVRFAAEADAVTPARLDALRVRHFAIRPERIADIRAITAALGALTGRRAAADSLVHRMNAKIAAVHVAVAGRPRLRVAYLLGGDPPRVAGPGTFIHEIIDIAGGSNAFADLRAPYPAVSPEALLARNPDVIVAPEDALLPRVLTRHIPPPTPSPTRAAPPRLVRVPADMFHRPSLDVAGAAEHLARILHPEAFP